MFRLGENCTASPAVSACHPTYPAVRVEWPDNEELKRHTAIGPAAEPRTSLNPPGKRGGLPLVTWTLIRVSTLSGEPRVISRCSRRPAGNWARSAFDAFPMTHHVEYAATPTRPED